MIVLKKCEGNKFLIRTRYLKFKIIRSSKMSEDEHGLFVFNQSNLEEITGLLNGRRGWSMSPGDTNHLNCPEEYDLRKTNTIRLSVNKLICIYSDYQKLREELKKLRYLEFYLITPSLVVIK